MKDPFTLSRSTNALLEDTKTYYISYILDVTVVTRILCVPKDVVRAFNTKSRGLLYLFPSSLNFWSFWKKFRFIYFHEQRTKFSVYMYRKK